MEHRVWDGELRFNNRPQEKLKKRSLLLTGPRENTWPWARVEGQGKKRQTDGDKIWAHAFVRVCG